MRVSGVGRVFGVSLAGCAIAACQLLSGVTELAFDRDGTPDITTDAVAAPDVVIEAHDAQVDAGFETLTITVDRPEAPYLTTAGEVDRITVGDATVCASGDPDGGCTHDIEVRVPRGSTRVEALAAAPSDVHFLEPIGCKKAGATCDLTISAATHVTIRAVRHSYVFVTKRTYPANMGGLPGADAICAEAAADEGLPGTYVAWLSTAYVDATSDARLGNARGFIRMDGRPFADTVSSLKSGKVLYPIQLDPTGAAVDPGAVVFTGTAGIGTFAGNSCGDWEVRANRYAAIGSAFGGGGEWTNGDRVLDCTNSAHLYCFRNDRAVPLTLREPPPVRRLAFLSTPFNPTGGRSELDQRCQSEASAAGLATGGRTYRAWIATTDASPPNPFNTSSALGGWYRLDGLPIFPDPNVLRDNDNDVIAPDAPIAQHADESYVRDVPQRDTSVWTGMNVGPNATATGLGFTCADWTSAANGAYARTGNAGFGSPVPAGTPTTRDLRATYFGGGNQLCSLPRSVYCLQQ